MREGVLDTETTGLDPGQGHRVVEIGGLELVNHLPTGRVFHSYLDPERADQAIELLREVRRENPRYIRGLTNLGALLADQGHTEGAIRVLEEMLTQPQVISAGVQSRWTRALANRAPSMCRGSSWCFATSPIAAISSSL